MHKKKITVLTFKNKKEQPIYILELFFYFRSPRSIDITVSCSFVLRSFHIPRTFTRYTSEQCLYPPPAAAFLLAQLRHTRLYLYFSLLPASCLLAF